MPFPFFYNKEINDLELKLEEETSRHIISVLRMNKGEQILLTDGRGCKANATIIEGNRKKCVVKITSKSIEKPKEHKVKIGISLIKNVSRFEWFIEKATEIGVTEIIPLICERTVKDKFRIERIQQIVISAMIQSQQCWLPLITEPIMFKQAISNTVYTRRFIAHCLQDDKFSLDKNLNEPGTEILIGPEGDFTEEEIKMALEHNYKAVSLGSTRLRTETAGIAAAIILCI